MCEGIRASSLWYHPRREEGLAEASPSGLGAVYDACDDGLVRVETPDGAVGFFRGDGSFSHGDLREADPQLCGWVGNDKSRRRFEPAKSD